MIPREILRKVKQIEIYTRGLVNDLFGGEYHSIFKGKGMTFSEVRDYFPGDDIRAIDWNVTARTGKPHVKVFEEERELTVYLLLDVSASGIFGSESALKIEITTEIAAILGFSAIKNNDKVGVILFSDEVEKYIPPKKGRSHVLRVIREMLYYKAERKGTSLQTALDFLLKVAKRRSVVFLISDYIDIGFKNTLKIANRKHDMIGIQISDPVEIDLPNIGLIKLEDPETGLQSWIDTGKVTDREEYSRFMKERLHQQSRDLKKIKFDLIQLSSTEDYVKPLMTYFKEREKRH